MNWAHGTDVPKNGGIPLCECEKSSCENNHKNNAGQQYISEVWLSLSCKDVVIHFNGVWAEMLLVRYHPHMQPLFWTQQPHGFCIKASVPCPVKGSSSWLMDTAVASFLTATAGIQRANMEKLGVHVSAFEIFLKAAPS